jgi:hypothetical protein
MSRYKGRQSAKAVEKDFPHVVDMVVPPGGLGKRLDGMYEFHARHGIKPIGGQGKHDTNRSVIHWCFANPELAAAFATEFAAAHSTKG